MILYIYSYYLTFTKDFNGISLLSHWDEIYLTLEISISHGTITTVMLQNQEQQSQNGSAFCNTAVGFVSDVSALKASSV